MLKAIFRAVSLVCLAVALVAAVLDLTRSIADSSLVLTPFYVDWARFSPASLDLTRRFLEQYAHPFAWDPVFVTLLTAPTWVIFAVFAVLFGMAARRRPRRWQENFEV